MPLSNPSPSITVPRTSASTGSAITNSLSTTTSVLVPANASRKGLTIYNNLSTIIYVDTISTVSATNFMLAIPPGVYFELPASDALYTGALHGILASGTGSALVREFT